MSDVIAQLEVTLKGLESKLSDALGETSKQIDEAGKVSKAAQDRVGLAEKALDEARAEFKAQVEKARTEGSEVSKAAEKRLADLERRFGRIEGGSGSGSGEAQKSIGRQFGDFLRENSEMVHKAMQGAEKIQGAKRLLLGQANFARAAAVADVLKANFMSPTEENIAKAVALSDATNFTPVYRDANLGIMPRRRLAMRDLIPSRPISVNSYEYLEHVGMGEETALSLSDITSVTTTATATAAAAHGLRVGDWVAISGAVETGYNGNVRVVTVPSATTFTYTIAAATADTSSGTRVYRHLSRYGAAAAVSEASVKPQSKFYPTLRTGSCQVLAHYMKITRQALDDIPGIEADINTYGVRGLAEEEEDQLLYGDGSAPNLTGILSNTSIQTRTQSPAGSVGLVSVFRQAMTDIELSGGMASAIVMNPVNWESTELARGLDDHFLFQGGLAGNEPRIWRVPIVVSKSIAPGTALLGAFDEGAVIYDRQAANIAFADQNDTDFLYNLLAIRFEERLGFAITRPELFNAITLL